MPAFSRLSSSTELPRGRFVGVVTNSSSFIVTMVVVSVRWYWRFIPAELRSINCKVFGWSPPYGWCDGDVSIIISPGPWKVSEGANVCSLPDKETNHSINYGAEMYLLFYSLYPSDSRCEEWFVARNDRRFDDFSPICGKCVNWIRVNRLQELSCFRFFLGVFCFELFKIKAKYWIDNICLKIKCST